MNVIKQPYFVPSGIITIFVHVTCSAKLLFKETILARSTFSQNTSPVNFLHPELFEQWFLPQMWWSFQ